MIPRRLATPAVLWWAVLSVPLAAQEAPQRVKRQRPHRGGLWVEIAGGLASMRVSCSERGGVPCTEDDVITTAGSGAMSRIGGVISDHILFAWESAIFVREQFVFGNNDTTAIAELESTGLSLLWFPGRTGLFLKGGVGVAQGRFTVPTGTAQADTITGTGIALTAGLGWDWSFSRKYALTLNLGAYIAGIGDLVLPGGRVDDVIGTMYLLTLSFTFR